MHYLAQYGGQAGIGEEQINGRVPLGVQHAVVAEDVVGSGMLLQVEVLHGPVAQHRRRRQQLLFGQRTLTHIHERND